MQSGIGRVVPLHLLLSKLDPKVIDQLPAGHALTGCDTVAKVGTKKELLNILKSFDPLITGFGREALDDDMLQQAEQFLINVVTKKYRSCSAFDELRAKLYHHKSNNKRFDLPCSLMTLHNNIRRAFLQTKLWLDLPFLNATDTMDFQDCWYVCNLNENMILPKLSDDEVKPLDVPESCKCTTCVKRTCTLYM